MSSIPIGAFIAVSAILFFIGVTGVLIRRNAVVILMCVELMLNATNLALVAFSRRAGLADERGSVFVVFVFVIAAAQCGQHEDGRATFGHSLVIDPWGEVLLDMGEGSGVGFADIDLGRVEEVRSRVPAIRHRRPIGSVAAA